jgi:predicted aldo/keto reductase-like oxidoreductase
VPVKYRKIGNSDIEISEISLGAEHLEGEDPLVVNSVVNHAMDQGINYIDLVAYTASADRDAMAEALRGRRDEVMISAHFGAVSREGKYFKTRDPALCEASLEDLLKRLHTDHTDVLMLHWIDKKEDFETAFDKNGYLGAAQRLKREGKARLLALSTHIVPIAERAIESGCIDALMFPVNPAHDLFPGDFGLGEMWDESTQGKLLDKKIDRVATRGSLHLLCENTRIGLIAMKPYAGGLLLRAGPMTEFLEKKEGLRNPGGMVLSPVQCLSYVLGRPGICTALVGFRSAQQIDAAVAYYEASEAERDFSSIDAHELWKLAGRCVYCNHCLPCPEDIRIGDVLRVLDTAEYSPNRLTKAEYGRFSRHATDCTGCEVCMDRCPFGVRVTERLEKAATLFGY